MECISPTARERTPKAIKIVAIKPEKIDVRNTMDSAQSSGLKNSQQKAESTINIDI